MGWRKKALDGILVLGAVFVGLDYLYTWQEGNILDLLKQDILLVLIGVVPIALLWLYLGRPERF